MTRSDNEWTRILETNHNLALVDANNLRRAMRYYDIEHGAYVFDFSVGDTHDDALAWLHPFDSKTKRAVFEVDALDVGFGLSGPMSVTFSTCIDRCFGRSRIVCASSSVVP